MVLWRFLRILPISTQFHVNTIIVVVEIKLNIEIVLLTKPFVLWRSRCRCRRGLLKVPNNTVTDSEFEIILAEAEQYKVLKEKVRAKLIRRQSPSMLIKRKRPSETRWKKSFEKTYHARRKFELTFENTRFYLHIIKT